MTVFQRDPQATHIRKGLDCLESFTSFPEHTLWKSGKAPVAEIPEPPLQEGQCTNQINQL